MIFHHFAFRFLAAWIVITFIGCAQRPVSSPSQETQTAASGIDRGVTEVVNLENLETDPALLNATTTESRNLRLGQLWFKRSEELSNIPGPSSLAALLRSSHFAIESLLSEPCANPFNETCRDLHRLYVKALEKLVREIARNGWELPNLAPSRYRFSGTDTEKLRSLCDWRFSIDALPAKNETDRAGLGLPVVGCRDRWGDAETRDLTGISICAPITFILTFERPTSEERLTAHLAAVNAYEQEVFETRGTAVPTASATSAALESILRGAEAVHGSHRLWCLTKPERTTTMALGIVSSPTSAMNLLEPFGAIARDPDLQALYTPCVFVTSGGGSISNATTLLRLARALVAPRGNAALEREPIRVFPIVSGNDATSMARALLARIKRQSHRASRAPGQPTTFSIPVMAINTGNSDAGTIDEIERYANDLNTPVVRTPNQADLLKELPSLARAYRKRNTPNEQTGIRVESSPSPSNELPLSPVM
jgi:hypothetical protein